MRTSRDQFLVVLLVTFLYAFEFLPYGVNGSFLSWVEDVSLNEGIAGAVSLVGNDNRIYLIGGYVSPKKIATSSVWIFNATPSAPREWISGPPLPTAVWGHCGCQGNDGKFYIFGGLNDASSLVGQVQIFDVTLQKWTVLNSSSAAHSNWSCATTAPLNAFSTATSNNDSESSSGMIFLIGGDGPNNQVIVFFPGNSSFSSSELPQLPYAVQQQGAIFVSGQNSDSSSFTDGSLYLFGGYNGSHSLSTVTVLSGISNVQHSGLSWSQTSVPAMPRASYAFGLVFDGTHVFIYDTIGIMVYDLSANQWTVLTTVSNNNNSDSSSNNSNGGSVLANNTSDGNNQIDGFSPATCILRGTWHIIGGSSDANSNSISSLHSIAALCPFVSVDTVCDNGNECTTDDTCTSAGLCVGSQISCSCGFACNISTGLCQSSANSVCEDADQSVSTTAVETASGRTAIIAIFVFFLVLGFLVIGGLIAYTQWYSYNLDKKLHENEDAIEVDTDMEIDLP